MRRKQAKLADKKAPAGTTIGKKVRPKDIIAVLAKEGVKVSSAQVSTTLRAAGYRRKRRGKKAVGNAAPAANGLNLNALIAAKELIQKAGGVKAAEAAIQAIRKLGSGERK